MEARLAILCGEIEILMQQLQLGANVTNPEVKISTVLMVMI
jgi:hypothetical protein